MTAATHTNDTAPATPWERHKWPVLAAVIAIQLLLVLLVVLPQLSPRVSWTELQLRVAPYDPIDPFLGAYVDLTYPDLPTPSDYVHGDSDQLGTAYVPLRQEGDVWVAVGPIQRTAPDGLFLACDDRSWRLKCGIESWFTSQSEAVAIEQEMMDDGAIATVRVDRWGNATIIGLEPIGG